MERKGGGQHESTVGEGGGGGSLGGLWTAAIVYSFTVRHRSSRCALALTCSADLPATQDSRMQTPDPGCQRLPSTRTFDKALRQGTSTSNFDKELRPVLHALRGWQWSSRGRLRAERMQAVGRADEGEGEMKWDGWRARVGRNRIVQTGNWKLQTATANCKLQTRVSCQLPTRFLFPARTQRRKPPPHLIMLA